MSLDKLTFQEIDQLDDSKKREAILGLGHPENYEAYDFLARYVGTDFRHQVLISMANINYASTIDILIGIMQKEKGGKSIASLSCIFFDRIASIGEKEFLQELKNLRPLETDLRRELYTALEEGIILTDIEDTGAYLSNTKKVLQI